MELRCRDRGRVVVGHVIPRPAEPQALPAERARIGADCPNDLADAKPLELVTPRFKSRPIEARITAADDHVLLRVAVVVVPVDPSRANSTFEAELVRYCRERLAAYKCPRSVDFRTEVPRGDNGKLYKRALRDEYLTKERRA